MNENKDIILSSKEKENIRVFLEQQEDSLFPLLIE